MITNRRAIEIAANCGGRDFFYTRKIAHRNEVPSAEWRDASIKEIDKHIAKYRPPVMIVRSLQALREWLRARKF